MVFKVSVSSFVKVGGQTSKNVHDVWKVFFKTTLYVYLCFVEFHVLVFNETHVVGPKIEDNHI